MLDFIDSVPIVPIAFENLVLDPDCFEAEPSLSTRAPSNFVTKFSHPAAGPVDTTGSLLRIGLIDGYRFSQECLVKAFSDLQSKFAMQPFSTAKDCMLNANSVFDLIIYYSHASETESMDDIASLRRSFDTVPLIVLSDAQDAHHPKVIYSTLKQGAHGFIPTRTMGIPMIVAAIRFVKAGGTFAPLDLLLTARPDPVREAIPALQPNRLTSRQVMVLGHLQQGKANKIIAHELGMSESTVKVHVRNIMRKMGATNRTQAAYKAQSLYSAPTLQT